MGEYSPEGKLISETIWLDDLPVATIRPKNANNQLPLGTAGTGAATANNTGTNTAANPVNVDVYYVHPDHLGTPRVATRSAAVGGATTGPNAVNKAVWRWDSDPFGTSLDNSKPNENPQQVTGTQTQIQAASFRVNNRFPGQVFDAETSKSYNYFRDYDPSIGRYMQSDPIGLFPTVIDAHATLSTFSYVAGNPMTAIDPSGLSPAIIIRVGAAAVAACMRFKACRDKLVPLIERAKKLCKDVTCELHRHPAHHSFPGLGHCEHYQFICHIKGERGSGFSVYFPLPGTCGERRNDF